jgi:uncharacterized membrane protein YhaH (DUF805 family)
MGFGEAISTCLGKYVTFGGRARRSEYWYWVLFQIPLIIVAGIIDIIAFAYPILYYVVSFGLFLPSFAVTVRRLHDTDRSGGWIALILIPLIGPIILFVMMCLRGTDSPNRFGPQTA